jgi:hypothetical protein
LTINQIPKEIIMPMPESEQKKRMLDLINQNFLTKEAQEIENNRLLNEISNLYTWYSSSGPDNFSSMMADWNKIINVYKTATNVSQDDIKLMRSCTVDLANEVHNAPTSTNTQASDNTINTAQLRHFNYLQDIINAVEIDINHPNKGNDYISEIRYLQETIKKLNDPDEHTVLNAISEWRDKLSVQHKTRFDKDKTPEPNEFQTSYIKYFTDIINDVSIDPENPNKDHDYIAELENIRKQIKTMENPSEAKILDSIEEWLDTLPANQRTRMEKELDKPLPQQVVQTPQQTTNNYKDRLFYAKEHSPVLHSNTHTAFIVSAYNEDYSDKDWYREPLVERDSQGIDKIHLYIPSQEELYKFIHKLAESGMEFTVKDDKGELIAFSNGDGSLYNNKNVALDNSDAFIKGAVANDQMDNAPKPSR